MNRTLLTLGGALLPCAVLAGDPVPDLENSPSRLSDVAVPVRTELDPGRTPPLVEWGDKLLGPGALGAGFQLPTGAVWQPALFVYGSYRTALQAFDNGKVEMSEWANRLDLVGNLRLTGTERLVVSVRPLDEDGEFTGERFKPEATEGWVSAYDLEPETLYFEGMFDELFPALDRKDGSRNDIGFVVGRQPVFFQEGMLINDNIDALGLVKSAIPFPGTANTRVSFLYGWNQVHRNDNREDDDARIAGVFGEFDFFCCTVNADLVRVQSDLHDRDGWFAGLSSVQRIGRYNTAVRVLHSDAEGDDNPAVSTGTLLFGELSWTPAGGADVAYVTAFRGFDAFASAARAPATGGALGRAGILFASVGMGRYGAALNNRPNDAWGGAVGYQMFLGGIRRQLVLEAGTRRADHEHGADAWAIGTRFQQAIGKRLLLQLDGFVGEHEVNGDTWGARSELQVKF